MTIDELAPLLVPMRTVGNDRLAGMQAFQRQCLQFQFRLLIVSRNVLHVTLDRQAFDLGSGLQPRLEFGIDKN